MGDHTETVRVEFNPLEITYPDLLNVFWAGHNPRYNSSRRQYRNAIFFLNDRQRQQAEQSQQQIAVTLDAPVKTDIEAATLFYPAEDYHQKYYLRREGAVHSEFKAIYPDEKQLAASTAVARVNGYLGCNGKPEELTSEIGRLGLSVKGQQRLIEHLSSSCSSFKGVTCPAPL
jgi:hypothetical protein